jgi:hypothetical protein
VFSDLSQVGLEADQVLLRKGEKSDRYYLVESGSVVVLDPATGTQLHEFNKNKGFGEQWLLFEDHPSAVMCRAGKDGATLLALSRELFQSHFRAAFTLSGPFRGRMVRAKASKHTMTLDRDVREFRGIRFASCPSRLALPALIDYNAGNLGVVDAFEFGPDCAQFQGGMLEAMSPKGKPKSKPSSLEFVDVQQQSVSVNEDCLCLNVYAPVAQAEHQRYPVMVWIRTWIFQVCYQS